MLSTRPLDAQTGHWALDASIGSANGSGGTFVDRGGIALDAQLSARLRPTASHSLIVAASGGHLGVGGYDASCTPGSDGECIRKFPHLAFRALSAGWEWVGGNGASVRFTVGPTWLQGGSPPDTVTGLQTRFELGSPSVGIVSAIIALRLTRLSDFQGEALRVWSRAFGLHVRCCG